MYTHVLPEASSCLMTMDDYSRDTAKESYIPKPGVKSEVWNYCLKRPGEDGKPIDDGIVYCKMSPTIIAHNRKVNTSNSKAHLKNNHKCQLGQSKDTTKKSKDQEISRPRAISSSSPIVSMFMESRVSVWSSVGMPPYMSYTIHYVITDWNLDLIAAFFLKTTLPKFLLIENIVKILYHVVHYC